MNRLLAIVIGVALAAPALAARDSAGTYTLNPSSPFVTGTPIASSTMNTRFSDLASELSDSLSRSGKGGMLAPLRTADGTVTLPAWSFTSETGTGFYRAGAGDLRCSVTGTDRLKLTSGGLFVDTHTALTATSATVKGAVADGASAVGVIIDNTIALANAGAKVVSFRSNGSEKAFISAAGKGAFAGVEATTGNVTLPQAAAQAIIKTGGPLQIGTGDAQVVTITYNSNGIAEFNGTGLYMATGSTIQNVSTPVNASDAATKGYVDGLRRVVARNADWTFSDASTGGTWNHGITTPYLVLATPTGTTGAPAAGSNSIRSIVKNSGNLQLVLEAPPGGGNSVSFDVLIFQPG